MEEDPEQGLNKPGLVAGKVFEKLVQDEYGGVEESGGREGEEGEEDPTPRAAAEASDGVSASLNPSSLPSTNLHHLHQPSPSPSPPPPSPPPPPSLLPHQSPAPGKHLSPAVVQSHALSQSPASASAPASAPSLSSPSPAVLASPMKYIPVSRLYSLQLPKPPTTTLPPNASPPPPPPPAPPPPSPSPSPSLPHPSLPSSSSCFSLTFLPFFYIRRRNLQLQKQQPPTDSSQPSLQTQCEDVGRPQNVNNGIDSLQQPQRQKVGRTQQNKKNSRLQMQVRRRKLSHGSLQREQEHRRPQDSYGRLHRRSELERLIIDRDEKRKIRTSKQRKIQYQLQHMRYPLRKYLTRPPSTSRRPSQRDRDAGVLTGTMLPPLTKRRKIEQEKPSGKNVKEKKSTEEGKVAKIEDALRQRILPSSVGHATMSCVGGDDGPDAEIDSGRASDGVVVKSDRLEVKNSKRTYVILSEESDIEDITLTSQPQDSDNSKAPMDLNKTLPCGNSDNREAPVYSNETLPCANGSKEGVVERSMRPVASASTEEVVNSMLVSGMKNNNMVTQPDFGTQQVTASENAEEKKLQEIKCYYRRRIRLNINASGSVEAAKHDLQVKNPISLVEGKADSASLDRKRRSVSPKVPSLPTTDEGRFLYRTRNSSSASKHDSKLPSLKSRHMDTASRALSLRNSSTNSRASPNRTIQRSTKVQPITSNGCHSDSESRESSKRIGLSNGLFPTRKKRKMQKVNEISNLFTGKSTDGTPERISTREFSNTSNSKSLQTDPNQKWRE